MTAKSATAQQKSAGVARIAGNMMILVGALGIVLTLLGKAFASPPLPPVVIYANITACVLEALLGVGVIQRKRPAWAYGVAIWGTFIVINLLSLPQMVRAGFPVGGFSAIIAGGRFVWGIVLLKAGKEF